MAAVRDVASAVETVPHALFSRVYVATRLRVRTVKTRTTRHYCSHATASPATTPCVMLVASDVTDKGYDVFS
jgi:hypothetical protein